MELLPLLRTYFHLKRGKEVLCGVRLIDGVYVVVETGVRYGSVEELYDGYNRQNVQ